MRAAGALSDAAAFPHAAGSRRPVQARVGRAFPDGQASARSPTRTATSTRRSPSHRAARSGSRGPIRTARGSTAVRSRSRFARVPARPRGGEPRRLDAMQVARGGLGAVSFPDLGRAQLPLTRSVVFCNAIRHPSLPARSSSLSAWPAAVAGARTGQGVRQHRSDRRCSRTTSGSWPTRARRSRRSATSGAASFASRSTGTSSRRSSARELQRRPIRRPTRAGASTTRSSRTRSRTAS